MAAVLLLVAMQTLLGLPQTASALELDWIPADGEGPLPLSLAYRRQLSRLCDIIEGGGSLPPSIASRLGDIEKMCAKLKRAERRDGPMSSVVKFTFALATAAAGGYAWHSYETKGWVYKLIQDQKRRARQSPQLARMKTYYTYPR